MLRLNDIDLMVKNSVDKKINELRIDKGTDNIKIIRLFSKACHLFPNLQELHLNKIFHLYKNTTSNIRILYFKNLNAIDRDDLVGLVNNIVDWMPTKNKTHQMQCDTYKEPAYDYTMTIRLLCADDFKKYFDMDSYGNTQIIQFVLNSTYFHFTMLLPIKPKYVAIYIDFCNRYENDFVPLYKTFASILSDGAEIKIYPLENKSRLTDDQHQKLFNKIFFMEFNKINQRVECNKFLKMQKYKTIQLIRTLLLSKACLNNCLSKLPINIIKYAASFLLN